MTNKDGKIGRFGGRIDHTQGRYKIPQSPFMSAESLVSAIEKDRGGEWKLDADRIGGRGEDPIPVAVNVYTKEIMTLWRDACGGWWVERQIRRGVWLQHTEYTLAIARHLPTRKLGASPGAGNWDKAEQDDMRHPTW